MHESCLFNFSANILLMEISGFSPYTFDERMETRSLIKKTMPHCKVVCMVDEKAYPDAAEKIRQAKREGLIDEFIYGSASATSLLCLMKAL